MKAKEFKSWLKSIEQLNRSQRIKLRERLEEKADIDKVATLIEQNLENKLVCPHCGGSEFHRWGKASELQRYRCRQCNRTFNALTGTPWARLRHKDKWLEFEQTMVDGLSLRKSANICGIAINTSFKWRHRFLQITATELSDKMNNIAETGETNYRQSPQGQHHLPGPPRKGGSKAVKRDTPDK